MSVRPVREVLFDSVPFALSNSPDKPAPTHVLNAFLACSLGHSPRGRALLTLIYAKDEEVKRGDYAGLATAEWADEAERLAAFRSDLSLIVDPDRRAWGSMASPFPIQESLVTSDPSDERMGVMALDLLRARVGEPALNHYIRRLFPDDADDVASQLVTTLLRDFPDDRSIRRGRAPEGAWYRADPATASGHVADSFTAFLTALLRENRGASRLMQIQHFSRGLYLVALLSTIYGPLASRPGQGHIDEVAELSPLLVWGDTPPGPPPLESKLVSASSQGFERLLRRLQDAYVVILHADLAAVRHPKGLPEKLKARSALDARLRLAGLEKDAEIGKAAQEFFTAADVDSGKAKLQDQQWLRTAVEGTYSLTYLRGGLRSMGRKIGLMAPDRGQAPRFVCETSLLATLVEGLCPDPVPFEVFIDTLRARLGIVVGLGSATSVQDVVDLPKGMAPTRRLLLENQESFRRRMIRSGLAREYSDGQTEVFRAN